MMKSAKFWGVLVLALASMAFLKWAHGAVYDSGYDAAEAKWQEAQVTAIESAVKAARDQWELSVEVATDNIIIEEKIVERIRVVEREVPKIVERVVAAECRDLGPDIQRVFNDAIRAAESVPIPGDTAEPDDEVPSAGSG